jgi:hypothetical protein
MKIKIEIPDYTPGEGIRYIWDENSRIECLTRDKYVKIIANEEALKSLAVCLLSLANKGVPSGHHIHLDDLRDGYKGDFLILERENTWDE